MTTTATHCPYCALQCAQALTPATAGVSVAGRDFPTNRGGLWRAYERHLGPMLERLAAHGLA